MPVIEKDGVDCYVSDDVLQSKIRKGWKLKEVKKEVKAAKKKVAKKTTSFASGL